jgi:hypothetical protein
MILPDQDRVLELVREVEGVFKDMDALYHETFPVSLFLAVVSANSMGMDKKSFLNHCETLFDNDKEEQMKELQ